MIQEVKSKMLFWLRKKYFRGVTIRRNAQVVSSALSDWVHISNYANVIESSIGRYSSIGKYSNLYYVNMGSFCSISWNVSIGATQHNIHYLTTHAFPYISMFDFTDSDNRKKTKTNIGHDVWIGTGAIIMPGITIGNGAIIGAGSIVTKDVLAYSIVVGNPATILRMRFENDIIENLENLKWWDWSTEKIDNHLYLFQEKITTENIKKL